jgi:DNA-binding MurR/RpiR family transcriptional regulator
VPGPDSHPNGGRPAEVPRVTDVLRALRPSLSAAQQRVADLAIVDPADVATLTIGELAAAADTSVATVQRLCRALDLDGYPQLRVALAGAAGRELSEARGRIIGSRIEDGDDLQTIIDKVAFADVRAVEDTWRALDVQAMAAAVNALAGARRIDIYGVGASASVAMDFNQKLHRIGRVAFAWQDQHMSLASAALMTADDVALGLSHTGTTRDTIEALSEAKRRGATTIALTNFGRSPLAELADIVVTTASRETTFRADAMASRLAQLTVIDILFVGVAQCGYEAALESLSHITEALKIRQVSPGALRRHRP